MADLGEGPGGPGGAGPPPLFWVKKEEMTEGKMAGMASKSRPPPPPPRPPLAQGLDPPLVGAYASAGSDKTLSLLSEDVHKAFDSSQYLSKIWS